MAELPFDPRFQDLVAAYIWRNPGALQRWQEPLKAGYFDTPTTGHIVGLLGHYYAKHKRSPSDIVLRELVRKSYPNASDPTQVKQRTRLEDKVDAMLALDMGDSEFIEEQIRRFVGDRAVRAFVMEVVGSIESGEQIDDLIERAKEAAQAGAVRLDVGQDWRAESYRRVTEYVNPNVNPRIPTGLYHLDMEMGGGLQAGEVGVLLAPPKGFKCSKADTVIMMHDGSTKKVQDVVVGDIIMGDDSTPRRVLEVGQGHSEMYDVRQSNGDDYTVTAEHVLCLKRPPRTRPVTAYGKKRYHQGDILEMTAKEYSEQTKWFRRTWKGYKVGVEFPKVPVPVSPYYVGLWLGDGHVRNTCISVGDGDREISEYLHNLADEWGLRVSEYQASRTTKSGQRVKTKALVISLSSPSTTNPLKDALRSVGLVHPKPKHLPAVYRFNDRETRLQVLAGMIDSDGHFNRVKGFIFSNTERCLCDDACWLARSLGFKSHVISYRSCCVKPDGTKVYKMAYRTLIQGQVSEIPTILPRKRGKDSVKVSERTAIKVQPAGLGDWYGFKVDGNNRYLLGDFTVTHNSGCMLNFGLSALQVIHDANVLYVTLELDEDLVGVRADWRTTMMTKPQMFQDIDGFYQALTARQEALYGDNRLFIKKLPPKKCNASMIQQLIQTLVEEHKTPIGMVIVDYLNLMTNDGKRIDKEYLELVAATTELRQVADDERVPIWTAARATRQAVGKRRLNIGDIAGAFEIVAIADFVAAICRTEEEQMRGQCRIVPIATRNDAGDKTIVCEIDGSRMCITSVDSRENTDEIDEEEGEKIQQAVKKKWQSKKKTPHDEEADLGGFDFGDA